MSRVFVSLLILTVFAPNAHAQPVEAGLALGLNGASSSAEPRTLAQSRWRAPSSARPNALVLRRAPAARQTPEPEGMSSTTGNAVEILPDAAAAIHPEAPQAPAPTDPAPTETETETEPVAFARHFGVQYSAGIASFIGDLRGPDVVFVQDIQAKVLHVSTLEDHLRYYLAIDVLITGAQAEGGAFLGYPDGAELEVLSFLFIPMVCGAPNAVLQVCGGIGQGTVNVNAERDRRDWGTWNYQAQIDVSPWPWLQFFALGKYVGAIEQQVDGVDSSFSFFTLTGGAGLTF
jgi:hypothetical protein